MKIALINPPWYSTYTQLLREDALSHCLGLGYLAAYLKAAGHEVEFIDGLAEGRQNIRRIDFCGQELFYRGLTYPEIIQRIPQDSGLAGISVPFTNLKTIAQGLCAAIKRIYPALPIVVGGVHPSTLPYDMLDENVDYVVRGEGEIPLQELAAGEDPHTIQGLVFREGGRIFDNGRAQAIEDLDQIPFPFRPGHLLEEYLHSSPRGQHAKQTLSLITSRGCPYDCTFCSVHPVSGYRWRKRSAQNVLEEISYYVERHNVNHLEFEDDNLTLDNQRAGQIFDGISGLNKKITWSANNGLRVDTLSAPLLKKMKDSGCQQVALAVESGSQEVLGLMQKKLSLEKVEEVVQSCSELKISTLAFFLVGYPGETDETFAATVKYIKKLKKLGLRGIGAMIVNAYPGTKLYDYCNSNGYLTCGIKEHIFNDADYVSVVTPDFDSRQVIYWRDLLQGLFHPLRWKIKEFGRIFFPALVFNKLLVFYRNLRDRRIRRLGYVSAR